MSRKSKWTKNGFREIVYLYDGNYKGFSILRIVREYFYYSKFNRLYDSSCVVSSSTRYEFVPRGFITHKTKRYMCHSSTGTDCREAIDAHLSKTRIIPTYAEYNNYVIRPNARHDYGFTDKMLFGLIRAHKRATDRRKWLYVERLEDANFHDYAAMLEREEYDELITQIKSDWAKHE